ncbi:hypothetical protein D3C73_1602750 [compost metagenome]
MVRQLGCVLQQVLIDVELILDLLGKLRDLGDLVFDLRAGLADQRDELTVVEKLRPLCCLARGRSGE